jgi:hypothetical protein
MNFRIEITGIKEYQQSLSVLARHKVLLAVADALNHTVSGARIALQKEMDDSFKPKTTPYLKSGIQTRKADKQNLSAAVFISDKERGKGSLSPSQILRPQIFGGPRSVKASERRLRMGFMGHGQYVVPGPGAPLDAYGNISAGNMQRILGHIKAYREEGFNKTKKSAGHYVVPFVGVFKRVAGGSSAPVLLFTYKQPHYEERFDFFYTVKNHVEKTFLRNLIQAWGNVMFKSGFYGK